MQWIFPASTGNPDVSEGSSAEFLRWKLEKEPFTDSPVMCPFDRAWIRWQSCILPGMLLFSGPYFRISSFRESRVAASAPAVSLE